MNPTKSRRPLPVPDGDDEQDDGGKLDQLVQSRAAQLVLWETQPITRPILDRGFLELPPSQRSVEVILYWMARGEHWLSPNGWLRAWVRLNLIIAVLLGVSALTVVPVGTLVLEGVSGWTSQVGLLTRDVGLAVQMLPPIVVTIGVVALGVHLFRRHHSRRSQPRYPRHEDFE